MAKSNNPDRLRLVFMERDESGVVAIADGQFQYMSGNAADEAMQEHLEDGDFQKLDCVDDRECYLREGAELPEYIKPYIKPPQI